ncbi:MAG: CapA family protein [Muribaculaceae bacterium]|nr:CapA family protein [Muribaculaceae bacterium]
MMRFKLIFMLLGVVALAACRPSSASGSGVGDTSGALSASASGVSGQATADDTVTIAMVGDIMLGTSFPKPKLPPDDGKLIFTHCADLLRDADVACGNLEGVIATEGKPRKNIESPRAFMFMMPPKNAERLVEAGFDFMGLANNHIFDFFESAARDTERNLDSLGIAYAGRKECESVVREFGGKRYGFCAFGHEDYCLRTQDTAAVRRIITELRSRCDILIVCFHGGAEGSDCRHVPEGTEMFYGDDRGNLRLFTHHAIDCGADIVYGHGPHVVRAMELYKGHLIAYSLGNFATPVGMGVASYTGYAPLLLARLNSRGELVGGKIHSFIQVKGLGPRRDSSNVVAREIQQLSLDDFPDSRLLIADDGTLSIRK